MSFEKIVKNGVCFFKSTLLPCPHAFSTRIGGVSEGYLATMNFGENGREPQSNVEENFRRLEEAAGLPEKRASAYQIHSNFVRYMDVPSSKEWEGDGFFTDKRGLSLCVKVADCIPILLYSEVGVSALHAGWRGSVSRIAEKGVEGLLSLGGEKKTMLAAIGTGIGPCCYEVGEDFVSEFEKALGSSYVQKFILEKNGRKTADLKGLNRELLLEAGLLPENIDVSPYCTCCESDLYFSHRATKGKRGTMVAMIAREF